MESIVRFDFIKLWGSFVRYSITGCVKGNKMIWKATLSLTLLSLFAAGTDRVLAGPQLEIINPTVNFGRVTQNKIVTTDFWIKSTGDDTLRITILWSGCGCAEIPLEDSTIAPGDSIPLRIIFSTGRFQGLTAKRPTVKTNASDDVIKLSILAEVILNSDDAWPVVLRPDILDVSQYGEKTRRRGSFHIENRSDEDLRVKVVDSVLKSFEVKIPNKIKAGETIEGRIRVREDMVTTDFTESVTFQIDGKESYFYTLPIMRSYRPQR